MIDGSKTKEEIIWEYTPMNEYPTYYHESDIELMMQAYADQEKRKEAVAFALWAADNGWLLYPDCDEDEEQGFYKPSDDFDIPDERMFGGQLYDLYLQSLRPIDQTCTVTNPYTNPLAANFFEDGAAEQAKADAEKIRQLEERVRELEAQLTQHK